jgi:hypothetical protein
MGDYRQSTFACREEAFGLSVPIHPLSSSAANAFLNVRMSSFFPYRTTSRRGSAVVVGRRLAAFTPSTITSAPPFGT